MTLMPLEMRTLRLHYNTPIRPESSTLRKLRRSSQLQIGPARVHGGFQLDHHLYATRQRLWGSILKLKYLSSTSFQRFIIVSHHQHESPTTGRSFGRFNRRQASRPSVGTMSPFLEVTLVQLVLARPDKC